MTDFDMDAFRRQMADDLRDAVRRQTEDLLQQARRRAPYPRHRNHDCDPRPSMTWRGQSLAEQFDVAWSVNPTPFRYYVGVDPAPQTVDGAFVITTLPTEGDQPA